MSKLETRFLYLLFFLLHFAECKVNKFDFFCYGFRTTRLCGPSQKVRKWHFLPLSQSSMSNEKTVSFGQKQESNSPTFVSGPSLIS